MTSSIPGAEPALDPEIARYAALETAVRRLAWHTMLASYLYFYTCDRGGDAFLRWLSDHLRPRHHAPPDLDRVFAIALSWPSPDRDDLHWFIRGNLIIGLPGETRHAFILHVAELASAPPVVIPKLHNGCIYPRPPRQPQKRAWSSATPEALVLSDL